MHSGDTSHHEELQAVEVPAAARVAAHNEHSVGKWQAIRENPAAFGWCLYAAWCTLLVSFENNAAGTVISIPQFRKDFGHYYAGDYVIPATWQSAFSGAPVASTAIGAVVAAQIADLVGRKKTIMLSLLLSYVSVTLEFVSTTNPVFFAGKLVNGLAVGILAATATSYVGEISPLALRGMLTCVIAFAYTIGPLTVALILNSTGSSSTRWAYRAIFCAQYGFCAVATVFVPFMPESPWWLVDRGQDAKALRSLRRLGYKADGAAEQHHALIKLTLDEVRAETEGVTYLECFRRSNLRRTIISIAPLSIQAFCGVLFIAGYSTYYIQLAGYGSAMSFKLNVALNAVAAFGNILSWDLIDRVGRRNLSLWGILGMTVILMLAGGLATANTPSSIKGCIAFMIFYAFYYNVTIGATAYTILTENATSRLRVKTIAIGVGLQNTWYTMWSFVLPYLFNPDKANLGAKISFIFGGMSVLCCIYVFLYQPETAGRSYEELDELYTKKVPARKFKVTVTDKEARENQAAQKVDQ